MWTRSELKEAAKLDLKRSYWGVVLMSLIFTIVSGSGGGGTAGNGSSNSISENLGKSGSIDMNVVMMVVLVAISIALVAIAIGLCIQAFVFNPLIVGAQRYFIEAVYGEKKVSDMKCLGMCFSNGYYKNVIKTMFLRNLYTMFWSMLFVIPGIIKGYEYRMIPYILAENPGVDCRSAFALSKEMMHGEKWKAFVLDLSFVGWGILAIFTCGILAIFYVNPYVQLTGAHLYETLKRKASMHYFDPTLQGGYQSADDSFALPENTYDVYRDSTNNAFDDNDMFGGPIE